jgi:hypothetical protein
LPFNEKLHSSLLRTFGEVRISNEGEGAVFTTSTDQESGRVYATVDPDHRGEQYAVCCPICGDTRFRLCISHRWNTKDPATSAFFGRQLVHCFNAGCDLSDGSLIHERAQAIDNLESMLRPYVARGMNLYVTRTPTRAIEKASLPGDCVPITQLPETHPAIMYLQERRFDPAWLERTFGLMFCREGKNVAGRIIIPIQCGGKLVGWQARYVGEPPTDNIPKYLNMTGLPKSRVVYNYDNAKHTSFGVIVEGVTDAWRIGPQAVAILGSTISTRQIELASAAWGQAGVALLIDGDARSTEQKRRKYEKVRDRLVGSGTFAWGVLEVILPDGMDPGDMTMAQVWQLIIKQAKAAGYGHSVFDAAAFRQAMALESNGG